MNNLEASIEAAQAALDRHTSTAPTKETAKGWKQEFNRLSNILTNLQAQRPKRKASTKVGFFDLPEDFDKEDEES